MKGMAIALMISTAAACAGSAAARDGIGFRGWGPRIGFTSDPDQLHFGAHADFGQFAEHIRWQPNIEVGVGSDETVLALNFFEAAFRFLSRWDQWSPYAGGGLGLNVYGDSGGVLDNSDTELGVNVLGGIERGLADGDRMFLEAKVGLDNSPDLKLTVGWTFY